jgi:hypothetical protein
MIEFLVFLYLFAPGVRLLHPCSGVCFAAMPLPPLAGDLAS